MKLMRALSDERLKTLRRVEKQLGFKFKNRELLNIALTHPSYAHERENGESHYERLEFIGDAVLDLVVARLLFDRYADRGEGFLTKARASLVNKNKLAEIASFLKLGDALLLGKGEVRMGGKTNAKILSAAFESVVGAMFLDGGYRRTVRVVERLFENYVRDEELEVADPRSELQEWAQSTSHIVPEYEFEEIREAGQKPQFKAIIKLNGTLLGVGKGPNKKSAAKDAARKALKFVVYSKSDGDR